MLVLWVSGFGILAMCSVCPILAVLLSGWMPCCKTAVLPADTDTDTGTDGGGGEAAAAEAGLQRDDYVTDNALRVTSPSHADRSGGGPGSPPHGRGTVALEVRLPSSPG